MYDLDELKESMKNPEFRFVIRKNIIDALGGVTVDSDYEFTTRHGNYHIVKGENELDGDKGLCFVRERYNLPSGDYDRGRNNFRKIYGRDSAEGKRCSQCRNCWTDGFT